MKLPFLLSMILLVGACDNATPERRSVVIERFESKVSDLFNTCSYGPQNALVSREVPVDVERISYKDKRASYSIILSHYPGDQSQLEGPMVGIGGPLDVLVLGRESEAKGGAYVIAFDSLGAVHPRAFGSVKIDSEPSSTVDSLFAFMSTWHRCGDSTE